MINRIVLENSSRQETIQEHHAFSLVIPVYLNQENISELLNVISQLAASLDDELEAVFVVDGSPDGSYDLLLRHLPTCDFSSKLIAHSRNFGSFAAIRTGLMAASGKHCAIMAADLQDPVSLIKSMFRSLESGRCDITIGTRTERNDPFFTRISSALFWWMYIGLISPQIPRGGVDVFGCNMEAREALLNLEESHSSLVSLLFWIGFKREFIPYQRLERKKGKSAWTFRMRTRYFLDSMFAFSDLPIKALFGLGAASLALCTTLGIVVFISKFTNQISIPGYAATVLIVLFFSALNSMGLAIIGSYTWRAFENTKRRPLSITLSKKSFDKRSTKAACLIKTGA